MSFAPVEVSAGVSQRLLSYAISAQLNRVSNERNLGIKIMPAQDQAEGCLMLETDRAASFVLDDIQLAVAIARSRSPSAYAISTEAFSKVEPCGIMLRKDDEPFRAVAD
jgi:glutamate/aspartate transport system substrate-binding protein